MSAVEIRERSPAAIMRADEADGTALSITCEVRAHTTVVRVRGTVDEAGRSRLAEALEVARMIRGRGPILVDLSGVGRVGSPVMSFLVQALREAERAGRRLIIQL